jgi:hypothetical protein
MGVERRLMHQIYKQIGGEIIVISPISRGFTDV